MGNSYDDDVLPLPRVDLNLLPDVDVASLPKSDLKDAPKKRATKRKVPDQQVDLPVGE